MPVVLILGGLAVGLAAQIADWLGADPQDVLFSGQASVPALVAEDSAKIVLVLLAAKAVAYAICLGCGFRGGPVFPAIFLGIALAMFAVIWFDVSPTLAVAVGAAAGVAAVDPPARDCVALRSHCSSAPPASTLCRPPCSRLRLRG